MPGLRKMGQRELSKYAESCVGCLRLAKRVSISHAQVVPASFMFSNTAVNITEQPPVSKDRPEHRSQEGRKLQSAL